MWMRITKWVTTKEFYRQETCVMILADVSTAMKLDISGRSALSLNTKG